MKHLVVAAGLASLLVFTLAASAPVPAGALVLRDVTVIDATGGAPKPRMAVVIEGERIREIRPLRGYVAPRRAHIIDARGKFLIPGLWDMHVHMTAQPMSPLAASAEGVPANSRYFLPLLVGYGITGVRDMSGNLALLKAWRDSIERRQLVGPRMVITGWKVGSTRAAVPGAPVPIESDEDVREVVRHLKRAGADFVKVAGLPREHYDALADECRRQGLPFAGHVSDDMGVADAAVFGQRSIEHLDDVVISISEREEELRGRALRHSSWWMRFAYALDILTPARVDRDLQEEILDSRSAAREVELLALLARRGTWQVPTLSGLRDVLSVREREPFEDEREAYLPPRRAGSPIRTPIDSAFFRERFRNLIRLAGEMQRAGIPIMAGTDAPGRDRTVGFALAEELELLVRAGLSPMQALQAATREPARYLGALDSLGTVERGKLADLVLLDADPLADIRNVHQVHAVVLRGRYLAPAEIQALRSSVRKLVQAWRDSLSAGPLVADPARGKVAGGL